MHTIPAHVKIYAAFDAGVAETDAFAGSKLVNGIAREAVHLLILHESHTLSTGNARDTLHPR